MSSTSGTLTAHSETAVAGTAAPLAQQEEEAEVMFEQGEIWTPQWLASELLVTRRLFFYLWDVQLLYYCSVSKTMSSYPSHRSLFLLAFVSKQYKPGVLSMQQHLVPVSAFL